MSHGYRAEFGTASATKRGRNPERPYVPVIVMRMESGRAGGQHTKQVLGRAYATRAEAVQTAQDYIDADIERYTTQLLTVKGQRAPREFEGLPRELADLTGLERFYIAGRAAAQAGKPRIPGVSTIVNAAIADLPVGAGAAEIMREWTRGWDEINLAATV